MSTQKSAANLSRKKLDKICENLFDVKSLGRASVDSSKDWKEKCPICLGKLVNNSFTDSCYHEFCFSCLSQWANVKPECPMCKKKFTKILYNIRSMSDYDIFEIKRSENNDLSYYESFMRNRSSNIARYRNNRFNDQPNNPNRYLRSVLAGNFRSLIYELNCWVFDPTSIDNSSIPININGRVRDVSPDFFRSNPACVHRLFPWLVRELSALNRIQTPSFITNVNRATDVIIHNVRVHPILDTEFRILMLAYVSSLYVDHFLHEFHAFAVSPVDNYNDYDAVAFYRISPHNRSLTAAGNYVVSPTTALVEVTGTQMGVTENLSSSSSIVNCFTYYHYFCQTGLPYPDGATVSSSTYSHINYNRHLMSFLPDSILSSTSTPFFNCPPHPGGHFSALTAAAAISRIPFSNHSASVAATIVDGGGELDNDVDMSNLVNNSLINTYIMPSQPPSLQIVPPPNQNHQTEVITISSSNGGGPISDDDDDVEDMVPPLNIVGNVNLIPTSQRFFTATTVAGTTNRDPRQRRLINKNHTLALGGRKVVNQQQQQIISNQNNNHSSLVVPSQLLLNAGVDMKKISISTQSAAPINSFTTTTKITTNGKATAAIAKKQQQRNNYHKKKRPTSSTGTSFCEVLTTLPPIKDRKHDVLSVHSSTTSTYESLDKIPLAQIKTQKILRRIPHTHTARGYIKAQNDHRIYINNLIRSKTQGGIEISESQLPSTSKIIIPSVTVAKRNKKVAATTTPNYPIPTANIPPTKILAAKRPKKKRQRIMHININGVVYPKKTPNNVSVGPNLSIPFDREGANSIRSSSSSIEELYCSPVFEMSSSLAKLQLHNVEQHTLEWVRSYTQWWCEKCETNFDWDQMHIQVIDQIPAEADPSPIPATAAEAIERHSTLLYNSDDDEDSFNQSY